MDSEGRSVYLLRCSMTIMPWHIASLSAPPGKVAPDINIEVRSTGIEGIQPAPDAMGGQRRRHIKPSSLSHTAECAPDDGFSNFRVFVCFNILENLLGDLVPLWLSPFGCAAKDSVFFDVLSFIDGADLNSSHRIYRAESQVCLFPIVPIRLGPGDKVGNLLILRCGTLDSMSFPFN